MKKIYYSYTQLRDGDISTCSAISTPEVGFDLTPITELVDSEYIYTKCPIWSHKASRTYVLRSPINFEFKITNNGHESIETPNGLNIFYEPGWDNKKPVIQLAMPIVFLWSDVKNLWVNIQPSPYTSLNNNFVCVGGWWNLSNWQRPISFAMQIPDPSKSIKVKRGDPLYYINFHTNDQNESFKLIRKDEIPEKQLQRARKITQIKEILPGISHKFIFKKEKESKCPLKSLWSK